tara:strand:- start:659 stop:1921 length:1263 start_codon:yes stop_codon:yes gene_type:complete
MEEKKITATGLVVWLTCAIFFLYEFLLRTVIGTFQHPIMADLELTTFKFSLLSSTTYLIVYGFMQIPVGIIVDNFGLKLTLGFAVIVCSLATLGFAFTYNYHYAIIFRMLTGFGSAFGLICLFMAVYEWLPSNRIGLFIGLSQFIGTLGPIVAAGPLDSLSNSGSVHWRLIFIYLSFIGAIISLLVFLFVKNNHIKSGKYTILYKPLGIKKNILTLFRSSQPWFIAIFCGIIYFSIEYFSENEGKNFIELKGHSSNFASYLITLSWVGYGIGCPTLGFFSDYFQRRRIFLLISSIFSFVGVVFLVYFINKYFLILGFFFIGLGASGVSIGFALMAEQFKSNFTAAGLGLNNAVVTTLSAFLAPLFGYILEHHSVNNMQLSDYSFTFSFLVLLVLLSIFIPLFFIKESYCKSLASFTVLKT